MGVNLELSKYMQNRPPQMIAEVGFLCLGRNEDLVLLSGCGRVFWRVSFRVEGLFG